MVSNADRLARLFGILEGRVTDLEQGRPDDAPQRRVENLADERLGIDDSVSATENTDLTTRYNDGDRYGSSTYE